MEATLRSVVCALVVVVGVATALAQERARSAGTSNERFEVSSIKAVRPTLVNTITALQKRDVAGARSAFEAYDRAWNGIEVYINFRSIDMYNLIEHTYQDRIKQALAGPDPDAAAIAGDAQAMLGKFDEAVSMIEKAPPISPLFDDVARLRIARANLLPVNAGLRAGDFSKVRDGVAGFRRSWSSVAGLVKGRSQDAHDAIERALTELEAALKQNPPNADQMTKTMSTLNVSYNTVLGEVSKEARAAK